MRLTEIAGRGQQVLLFTDYMERLASMTDHPKIVANAPRYRKLGSALFKAGFTYDDTSFHKLPTEGGSWEFDLPSFNDIYGLEQGYVSCICSLDIDGTLHRFSKTLSLNEIDAFTLPELMSFMTQSAKPV